MSEMAPSSSPVILISEESRQKVLGEYREKIKALAAVCDQERVDARRSLLQFGQDLLGEFGGDGFKSFARFWVDELKNSAEMKPGGKEVLSGCRDLSKVLLKIQEVNLDNMPDVSTLSDDELQRLIDAETARILDSATEQMSPPIKKSHHKK